MQTLIMLSVIALLSACAHPTFDLLAHEESHCREWGTAERSRLVHHFTDDAASICRAKTGKLFVDACAQMGGDGYCHMWLPMSEKEKLK